MPAQGAVQGLFKNIIKSSGYVKHFRHQCTALIQICRDLWELVAIMNDEQYQSFQKFVTMADEALQAVAGFEQPPAAKSWSKEQLQETIDEAIVELKEYCETLTLSPEDPKHDFERMIIDARIRDQERSLKIAAVEKLKKIPETKSEVEFYIHDGGDLSHKIRLNICKKSKSEEVLFKLGRNVAIKLHENAYLYTGREITWENEVNKNTNEGGEVTIKLGSDPRYCPKKGIPDFKAYFDLVPRGPVHVFVDRKPSIHILLTTEKWSRLFSLAKLITIDREKVVVLKGTDGVLYHAQQVVGQMKSNPGAAVFYFNRKTNAKVRTEAKMDSFDYMQILRGARDYIIAEGPRWAESSDYQGWLVQITPTNDLKPPDIPTNSKELKIQHRPKIKYNFPSDSSPPMSNIATSSTETASRGLGLSKVGDATTRVRDMVAKIDAENKKKEVEKKGKKGIWNRVFG